MNISSLINSWKTVFSIEDLWFLLDMQHTQSLRNYVSKLWKQGILQSLGYGIRWFKNYNRFELVCKLKKTSYISLQTVLAQAGIIYQEYGQMLFACSDTSVVKQGDIWSISYHQIKSSLLLNPMGILHQWQRSIATAERALCDMLYLQPDFYCDDCSSIDWDRMSIMSAIYPKSTRLVLEKLHASQRHS